MVKIKALFGLGHTAGWLGRYTYRRAGVVANPYPIGILPKIKIGYYIPAFGLNPYPPFISQYYSVKGWIYQRRRTWHGIEHIAKRANIPREPGTPYQMGNWIAFRDAVLAWKKLTKEQKDIYNKWTHPRHASGYNRFISWYLKVNKYMPIYWGTLRRSETDDRTIEDYTVVRHNPQITYPFQFYNKQAFNFVLHKGDGFPQNPVAGQLFYREDEKKVYKYDGVAWQEIGGGGASKIEPTEAECNEQNRGLLKYVRGVAGADDRVWICKRDYNLNYRWQLLDPPIPGFKYLRTLTVDYLNGLQTLTDYQLKFTLDTQTLINEGKLKPDLADIRILDTDNQTELPYWIEGPLNSNQTVIWVRKPTVPGGWFTFMYLYYGNNNAKSKSSISETFISEINGGQPLIGSWSFDEGQGNLVGDKSGNNNNGIISGATWDFGKYGGALSFDGINDYVNIPDTQALRAQPFTISLWFKWNDLNTSNIGFLTAKGYEIKEFHTGGGAGINGIRFIPNGVNSVIDVNNIIHSGWNHLVGVFTGNAAYVYFDGVLVGTRTGITPQYNASQDGAPFRLGARTNSTYFFKGVIDQVQFFNRALTQAEIVDLYNNYGYATPMQPGRVLIRKIAPVEPNISINDEL